MTYFPGQRTKPALKTPAKANLDLKTGAGFFTALVVLFTALQATGVINWPLWAILAPWFVAILFGGLILILGVVVIAARAAR